MEITLMEIILIIDRALGIIIIGGLMIGAMIWILLVVLVPFARLIIYIVPFAQLITYIMSIIRWFITDHYSFWHGFKELIWALVPLINFTYVWDWWFDAFSFIF